MAQLILLEATKLHPLQQLPKPKPKPLNQTKSHYIYTPIRPQSQTPKPYISNKKRKKKTS